MGYRNLPPFNSRRLSNVGKGLLSINKIFQSNVRHVIYINICFVSFKIKHRKDETLMKVSIFIALSNVNAGHNLVNYVCWRKRRVSNSSILLLFLQELSWDCKRYGLVGLVMMQVDISLLGL